MFSIVSEVLLLLLKLLTFAGIAITATSVRFSVKLFVSVTLLSNSAAFVSCLAFVF